MSRSHFVAPPDWQENVIADRFRDWLIFDSFVMMNGHGSLFFDDGRYVSEVIDNPEDDGDRYKAEDYADVVQFLVGSHAAKPEGLQVRSYADLYEAYRALSPDVHSVIEWYVSIPPNPTRFDPFFGHYWGVLHATILIEKIIGSPPSCSSVSAGCEVCGASPRPHHRMTRSEWLRQELKRRTEASQLVEQYASVIEAGIEVRNRMSHGPHFDRSSIPPAKHGDVATYDVSRSVKEFKENAHARTALIISLREIAHALLVDQAFGIKFFAPIKELKVATIGG